MWFCPTHQTSFWTQAVNVDSVVVFWPPGCWHFLWIISRTDMMICTSMYAPVFWFFCFMSAEISSPDPEQLNSNPLTPQGLLSLSTTHSSSSGTLRTIDVALWSQFEKKKWKEELKVQIAHLKLQSTFLACLHLYLSR